MVASFARTLLKANLRSTNYPCAWVSTDMWNDHAAHMLGNKLNAYNRDCRAESTNQLACKQLCTQYHTLKYTQGGTVMMYNQ